jgi:hypothetical protein
MPHPKHLRSSCGCPIRRAGEFKRVLIGNSDDLLLNQYLIAQKSFRNLRESDCGGDSGRRAWKGSERRGPQ